MLNNPCLLELMLSYKVFLSHILELAFELSGSHKGFSYTLVNSRYPFFFPFPSAPFPLNPLVTSSSLFFLVTCILLSLQLYLIGLYGIVGFLMALHITLLWFSLPSILWFLHTSIPCRLQPFYSQYSVFLHVSPVIYSSHLTHPSHKDPFY